MEIFARWLKEVRDFVPRTLIFGGRLDGRKELTAPDFSIRIEGPDGKLEKTIDANHKERRFKYDADGKDRDGFVNKDEIDRAMVDGDFKGEDAQFVAALKENYKVSTNSGHLVTGSFVGRSPNA